MNKGIQPLLKQLSNIVGAEWVASEGTYVTVSPRTDEDISRILRVANRTGRPVVPLGGGTGWWSPKRPGAGGILIRMTRMNHILKIDTDVMAVTAEAGINYSRLEEEIGRKGWRLAILPESGRVATLGGHIETWGTSPFSSAFFEDQSTQVIGLKVILPTGEIIQTGSSAITTARSFARRFFPSDLTGLFIGAEGAFGIIAEATLKLHPIPETVLTRMIHYRDVGSAVATLRKIQETQRGGGLSTVHEQRVMQKKTVLLAVPRLAGSIPRRASFTICFGADGNDSDVRSHMERVCRIAAGTGGKVSEEDMAEWWEGRYGLFPEFVLSRGPRIMLVAMTPMGKFEKACKWTEQFGKAHDMDITLMGYPLGGPVMLTHAIIRVEDETKKAREQTLALARKVMKGLMDMGSVPHRVGTDFLPVLVNRLDPSYYRMVKKIKNLLDPNGIMRPGVVVLR